MSEALAPAAPPEPRGGDDRSAFSPRTILALVLVGIVSFAGLAVLAAYAPDLRGGADGGAHALSSSAVGFKGAMVMLEAEGAKTVVSRTVLHGRAQRAGLTVITPSPVSDKTQVGAFLGQPHVLIVLPKWVTAPHQLHLGWVDKVGVAPMPVGAMLASYAKATKLTQSNGISHPRLHGAGRLFAPETYLQLGEIDSLHTLSGDDWVPELVDDQGRAVLASAKGHPEVLVLADPDLLNNQGLARLDNARAGMAILNTLRGDDGVIFDVTLNGFSRGRGIGRLMLEPPWLAATLCGVAAALLMGLHALARFGPVAQQGRAIALGKRALVDNSAGLVRMARREAELAPAYAALTRALIGQAAGGGRVGTAGGETDRWLADLARRRGAAAPDDLAAEADRAKSRDDLLAVGRKLYSWRLEITRERR